MRTALPVIALLALLTLLGTHAARADEAAIKLKDGAGRELVAANCVPCHSVDYVGMNSPFLDRKGWEATVTKMIKVMGAKISQDDTAKIVDYLTQNYGKS